MLQAVVVAEIIFSRLCTPRSAELTETFLSPSTIVPVMPRRDIPHSSKCTSPSPSIAQLTTGEEQCFRNSSARGSALLMIALPSLFTIEKSFDFAWK